MTDHLRFGADYRADGAWSPRLSYTAEGGFDLAIEKCFGAGLCLHREPRVDGAGSELIV